MDLDLQLGLDLRDAGIERAEENAASDWKEEALAAAERACRKYYEFTVDDIQRELALVNVETHEGRAMGAIVLQAVRAGWMEPSGRFTKSAQPQCHGNPRTVWRSKLK